MEKQKRWQGILILTVIFLTLYNILPTIFYYSKPLQDPVDGQYAKKIEAQVTDRVNSLEKDSKDWLYSFAKLLHVKPTSIALIKDNVGLYEVTFNKASDAEVFKRYLPRAGSFIPFAPAQLELNTVLSQQNPNTVVVERQIGVHFDKADLDKIFTFAWKKTPEGAPTEEYRNIVYDRAAQLAVALGSSKNAQQLQAIVQGDDGTENDDAIISLARDIVDIDSSLGSTSPLAKRYMATYSQMSKESANKNSINTLMQRLANLKKRVNEQKGALLAEQKKLQEESLLLDSAKLQQLALLENQSNVLEEAGAFLKKNASAFEAGKSPISRTEVLEQLAKNAPTKADDIQVLDISGYNPFVQALLIDWENDTIQLKFYDDVQALREKQGRTEADAFAKERLNQLLINEIARASYQADENIAPAGDSFAVALNNLANSSSLIAFNLRYLAEKQTTQIRDEIEKTWNPQHSDLGRSNYPVRDYAQYVESSPEDQKLGLVVYAPAMHSGEPIAGFRSGSIYVIARGLNTILQKYRSLDNAEGGQAFIKDFNELQTLLQQNGFIAYSGQSYGLPSEFHKDYIFELSDYYGHVLQATREDFAVKGSKRYATLEFTNVEQRILTTNKIDDRIQEDLVKWKEEYSSANVDMNSESKYTVPAPTKNVYLQNLKLSFIKYFRGDDRKILKWGLDLSGGKTVRIGLRDQSNRPVTNPDDIKQVVNELYARLNKMGVAERTIRVENENILLDFPGSQGLSASDLVKASAMYFHIVNEKFAPSSPEYGDVANNFLQEVWNEAVVTNRKDSESVNEIAWQHLGAISADGQITRPMSENAKILYDNGLRLVNPKTATTSNVFDDTLSSIGVLRGDDITQWHGQMHPLMVLFHNYALEGSSLENIQVGYDPNEGNTLTFGVKRSYASSRDKGTSSPRDDFYSWTSQYAKDKIAGTPKEIYSRGNGWRMAVILNGTIITSPTLSAALSNQASITGRFSQREVNQLAADLKAGSLSFTPKILSEHNVSPELGREERTRGIAAAVVALCLVIAAMISYYRFAGLVASCALLFNLLIIWGVLQNLGAALTLPGIAAIVLTIAMAVDANVLVFERVREEFKITGRIASAIQAGYRKAFSAIIDSNVTTILAAIILTQFDSGPIKGFAVNLIIGILSSMFTALFMTRYFFAGWVRNPKNKSLSMAQFISSTNFDFLSKTKMAVTISIIVMAIGTFFLINQRNTIFGMDFTGGYSLTVQLEEKPQTDYRIAALDALTDAGAKRSEVEVRELSRPNQLRIQLGMGMEESGHPFYNLPERVEVANTAMEYQKNPRIAWVVDALAAKGLHPTQSQIDSLESNWTVMSGQLSDAMRNNALIAVAIAVVGILLYITFRFEFKYAVGAVVGLLHDVLLTLGILAILNKMGLAVQIDLQVVGAIMTIIGYSLNDTIIVFDRIREDIKIMRKMKFYDLINHALNITLSRTLITSGTTLLVLLTLVFLGGSTIFSFSVVMAIGVLVGTLSSLFIAAPVMLYIHDREEQKQTMSKVEWKKSMI